MVQLPKDPKRGEGINVLWSKCIIIINKIIFKFSYPLTFFEIRVGADHNKTVCSKHRGKMIYKNKYSMMNI